MLSKESLKDIIIIIKRMWVSFMEIGEHAAFNLKHLIDHQEEFEEDYKGKIA